MSNQTTETTTRNYDPGQMIGVKVSSNDIGPFLRNCITNAPGLAISAGGSVLAKSANTFGVRVGDITGVPVTTTNMPSLATATDPSGAVAGNLAFDDGTVPATTLSCRMYTFLCDVNALTGATTLSVVCGYDFPKHRPVNVTTDINLGNGSKAVVGYLYVKNETSAVFIPNSTVLDVGGGLTVSYGDAFGYMSYNALS